MHILIIHQAFIGLDEAGGTRHIEIARHLAAKGHQVTIIAGTTSYITGLLRRPRQSWKEVTQPFEGITVIYTLAFPVLHRGFIRRLISFFSFMVSSFFAGLSVRNIDIIMGTSPPIFQAFTAWLLAFLKRKPFVFEVRDLWPAFAVAMDMLKNKLLIKMSLLLEKFLYKQADQLIVNSPGYIEHIESKGGKDIKLVPNGVDTTLFDPNINASDFRNKHRLQGKFVVIYAGAHGPSNDLDTLLQAANQLRETRDIHFLFVGDGKNKPALMAEAKQLDLQNVSFIPPVAKKEVNLALCAADACIAILKPIEMYKTTYPNKVFDYMAAGRPVILAIDGVIRELVEEAQAGIFVQPGDSYALAAGILELYRNPPFRLKLGSEGRSFVEKKFNRKHFAEQLELIFLSLQSNKQ